MQKAQYFLLLLIVSLVVGSCQKESFDGYTEIAVGRWQSVHAYELVSNIFENSADTIGVDLDTDLEVLILDRGRICIYENGKKVRSSRIEQITVTACCEPYRDILLDCPNLTDVMADKYFVMDFEEDPNRFQTPVFRVPPEDLLPNSYGRFYVFERVD